MDIDLDEAARAREEKVGDAHTLTFKGKAFDLPPTGPFAFMKALGALLRQQDEPGGLTVRHMGLFEECLETALGEDQLELLLELKPSFSDLEAAINLLSELYTGRSRGNSAASGSGSKITSKSSRRTSSRSTGSTSPKRSGGRTP